jgi:hypothetical protein
MVINMGIVNNKRGWLEIVEAFVAVLLVATVLLIILNKGYFKTGDTSQQVYNVEVSIIREIQTDSVLRGSVASVGIPIGMEDTVFPTNLKDRITARTPSYLECTARICDLDATCNLEGTGLERSKGKDVYSEVGIISATIQQGQVYRQLKLFCWMK